MTMRIDVPEGKHPVMFAWGEAVPLGTGAPAGLDTPSPGGCLLYLARQKA